MPGSNNQKVAAFQPKIKLPIALVTITCPDKSCMKCFKTEQGLVSHFDKSPGCAQAITKVLQCLLTQQLSTPMMMHSAVKAADNTNQVEEESGQSD